MKILVTGTAGFIGYHFAQRLIARGDEVVGLINLSREPIMRFRLSGVRPKITITRWIALPGVLADQSGRYRSRAN